MRNVFLSGYVDEMWHVWCGGSWIGSITKTLRISLDNLWRNPCTSLLREDLFDSLELKMSSHVFFQTFLLMSSSNEVFFSFRTTFRSVYIRVRLCEVSGGKVRETFHYTTQLFSLFLINASWKALARASIIKDFCFYFKNTLNLKQLSTVSFYNYRGNHDSSLCS